MLFKFFREILKQNLTVSFSKRIAIVKAKRGFHAKQEASFILNEYRSRSVRYLVYNNTYLIIIIAKERTMILAMPIATKSLSPHFI